ncbi:hypothetical protein LguiB_010952 [Lonicera macranthoides]
MESSLQFNGIRVSPPLVHQTLIRLKNVSKIAFAFFSWAKEQADYRHDSAAYDLMVDILGKVRQFDVAWQLIIEMDQENVKPTKNTFLALIRRLISAGFTRQAIRALDDMECFVGKEVEGNEFCYLLDTLCKYGYVKVATEIFNKQRWRFEPDAKMYTVLIYGWCKVNRAKMAERFFREMVDRGIEPNVITYNVLLNGICRRSSLHPEERFERTIRAAEDLLDEMLQRGIEPDVTSYSIVLHVYSRAHKPVLSLDKLKMMKSKGVCPSVASYTSVVKCLCSCGMLEEAEELLSEMECSGVSPSALTYNCFFKEYRGRKDADSALKLYRKMKGNESSSCLLSMHTYNILVGMFTKLNRREIVKEVWDDMKASGIGPDLDSYTMLIHNLCEKQKWREACEFFVEMIEKGLLPQKWSRSGYTTMFVQMRVPHMLFTGREDYKVRGTQATQRHKLVETQDVVLIRRDIVFTSNLSYSEAKLLLVKESSEVQSFYLNNTRYKLVERFNKESSEFEFKDVLQALDMPSYSSQFYA